MALSPGTRLGPYEIQSPIGAGGMGEVYKARDTRLDRVVAVKILPPQLASDPQFRERFDREARTISKLDHPNICQLHDVGEQAGTSFLVMQYLEGETLADRLARAGALPLVEALTIATEVGGALDRAHRAGVVHRDLKPGNIFLTKSAAKLLDFGLAKSGVATPFGPGNSMAPTTPPVTAQGTILGTFQYMAPEQIEGQDADARTDIFAFGLVLYEMLTGRPAFSGKSTAGLMSAILKDTPDIVSHVSPSTPPGIDRVVEKCLAKNPDNRWQSIRDAVEELNWASSQATVLERAHATHRQFRWKWLVAGSVLIAFGLAVGLMMPIGPSRTVSQPLIRFQVSVPSIAGSNPMLTLSPDGRSVAFTASDSGGYSILHVRSLDATDLRQFPQVRNPQQLVWSPDGREIGFVIGDLLRTINLATGLEQNIGTVPFASVGGGLQLAWGVAGDFIFGSRPGPDAGLYRFRRGDAAPRRIVSGSGVGFVSPTYIEQEGLVAYIEAGGQTRRVCVVDLDGHSRGCLPLDTLTLAYSSDGYLLFHREATLLAQRFDPRRAISSGAAAVVAEQVAGGPSGVRFFSAAGGSVPVVAYFSAVASGTYQFAWFDRDGKRLSDIGERAAYGGFDLSLDGRFIVASGYGATWVIDVARGVPTRVDDPNPAAGATFGSDVIWSPDASRFVKNSPPTGELIEQPAFGGRPHALIKRTDGRLTGLEHWSRDGRYVLLTMSIGTLRRTEAQPVDGGPPINITPQTNALVDEMQFSPDGRWVSYNSDESGRNEVYVTAFPPTGERWRVSTAGGVQGRWRGDSRELYFLSLDGTLMAVSFAPGTPPELGTPAKLFKTPIVPTYNLDHFAPDADGRRFLLKVPPAAEGSLLNVVVNWTSALPKP